MGESAPAQPAQPAQNTAGAAAAAAEEGSPAQRARNAKKGPAKTKTGAPAPGGAPAAAPARPAAPAAAAGKTAKPGQPAAGPAPAAPSAGTGAAGAAAPELGNIDQILEGDEEVLAGGSAYSYDPGNRRDPFKSLLVGPDRPEFRGPRPEGVPGLLIDEIDLKGIFRTARGYVAQVNAPNQKKSFLIKEGDQLYDGDVVSIGKSEVVFKQIVQDPTALKPFREVVKSLNPQQ
ncbi:MAG TPA: hypothetical protein VHR45_05975 [Thermoanaerobaculia bacterium]|nr:hypothetical protein [Thermoanaerobaculia bacterium]